MRSQEVATEKNVVEGLEKQPPQEDADHQGIERRSLELRASSSVYQDSEFVASAPERLGDAGINAGRTSLHNKTAELSNVQRHVVIKEGVPDIITDSGYKSETVQQSRLEEPSGKNSLIDDDGESTYSHATGLTSLDIDQYISDMTDDLLEIVGPDLTENSLACTAKLLPRLLEVAAIKVGMDTSDPQNIKVMYFVHRYRKSVFISFLSHMKQFANRINRKIVEEFKERLRCRAKDAVHSMPLLEKMDLWHKKNSASLMHPRITDEPQASNDTWQSEELDRKSRSRPPSASSDNGASAAGAEIEASGVQVPAEYTTIWSTSHGRNWLRETLQQSLKLTIPDDKEAYWEFQRVILENFPKRKHISPKANPEPYVARFEIAWNPWDFHINEGYDESIQEVLARAITLTGSEECNQVSTSLDYMIQTWPQTGQSLIEVLQYAVNHNSNTVHTCKSERSIIHSR